MLQDGSTRWLVVFTLLGLCAISLRLAWGVSGEFPINLGTSVLAQQGGCAPATKIVGSGTQESEPFNITGQTFQITENFNSPSETERGFAFYNVVDENGGIVQPASQNIFQDEPFSAQATTTFNSGPGTYTLEIVSANGEYDITVEDCGGSAARGVSHQPKANQRQPDAPKGIQDNQNRNLLQAGGPDEGPMPIVPGGGCPKEYPTEQNGACHK